MVQPSLTKPALTPQFCFSPGALNDFLRLSRATIDDSISASLNALLNPARQGFDPNSTARQGRSNGPTAHTSIPPATCRRFREDILFPSWLVREQVLEYCAGVARAEDPDDPGAVERARELERRGAVRPDERMDPYSARWLPREKRTEVLEGLVRNERGVERIVREGSWEVVMGRCGEIGTGWEEALERWRREKGR